MAFIPAVKILHEYMHKPRAQALTQANLMLRWFLKTRYFAMVARQHFVHHEAPNSNYNFMPGGDIFFGTLRKPTVEELLRLRELDAIF